MKHVSSIVSFAELKYIHVYMFFWKRVGDIPRLVLPMRLPCVIGKQTVADCLFDWLAPHCPSATRKISGPGLSNKRLGATTLCVFVCSCMCVAVTAQ